MNHLVALFFVFIAALMTACGQLATDSLQIVDYHVHVYSEDLLHNLELQDFSFERFGFEVSEKDLSAYRNMDKILRDNSQAKMLLISGGYAYKNIGGDTIDMTRTFVRRENDLLSQLVSSYPDRLLGFCGVDPLQPFSPEEIRRCREELGLHGVKLHLQGNRVDLADPDHLKSLKEVLVLAAALRMPVLIHNNASSFDNGRPYAERFIQDLLSELDPITILFAHTGGGGLYFDFTHEFLEVFAQYFREKSSRRHQIYFELSGTVSGTDYPGERSMDELAAMIMEIGPERFLFGSDYPYRVSSSYIKEITRELKLDPQILKQIIERDIFEELKK